ncbi:MAG: hypothetical protein ACP5SJ_03635 [Candidatus Micrarchaeia archaeon]
MEDGAVVESDVEEEAVEEILVDSEVEETLVDDSVVENEVDEALVDREVDETLEEDAVVESDVELSNVLLFELCNGAADCATCSCIPSAKTTSTAIATAKAKTFNCFFSILTIIYFYLKLI